MALISCPTQWCHQSLIPESLSVTKIVQNPKSVILSLGFICCWLLNAAVYNSGQRCTAIKVVLVMESVADALVEKVNVKLAKLTVGAPEDDCDITPVVTESSANFIEGLITDAKQKEATFCQEYKREGNLIYPLLLDNIRPDMRIAWEEPFGPVLPVIRINSVEEGIHHCNASNFGLQVLNELTVTSFYNFLPIIFFYYYYIETSGKKTDVKSIVNKEKKEKRNISLMM